MLRAVTDIAKELDLELEVSFTYNGLFDRATVTGVVDDFPVRGVFRGSQFSIGLAVPLDLALQLTWRPDRSLPTGAECRIAAEEPARGDLLLNELVRTKLLPFEHDTVVVTDSQVEVEYGWRGWSGRVSAELLGMLVRHAIALCRAIDQAREQVPSSQRLDDSAASPTTLAEGSHFFEAHARFPGPIRELLSMAPRGTGLLARWFADGRLLGDRAFDERFRLRFETAAGVRTVLDAKARALALALLEDHGHFHVDGGGVHVSRRADALAPDRLTGLVDGVIGLAQLLAVNAGVLKEPRGGHYR